jgi:hypothetical protein
MAKKFVSLVMSSELMCLSRRQLPLKAAFAGLIDSAEICPQRVSLQLARIPVLLAAVTAMVVTRGLVQQLMVLARQG